eukprot:TRINITY_DN10288_c0_g1_i2.p1 TRINITY_DN10288_c0_g1~~TRINITY_DN10288_c0_g1_i2.p1  ORF type:complete len:127 (-),score=28.92 TRINITY_DN10288_c0_g1_i2:89-469(-)
MNDDLEDSNEEQFATFERQMQTTTQQLAEFMARREPSIRSSDYESDGSDVNPFHRGTPYVERHRAGRQEDRGRDLGIKIEIPEYHGNMRGDDFLDWMDTIDRIFYYKEVAEECKVKLIAMKLKGRA